MKGRGAGGVMYVHYVQWVVCAASIWNLQGIHRKASRLGHTAPTPHGQAGPSIAASKLARWRDPSRPSTVASMYSRWTCWRR